MAMKIGSKYLPADLRLRHWEAYWTAIGFSPKQALQQTERFLDKIQQILPDSVGHPVEEAIQGIIQERLLMLQRLLKP